MGLSIWNLVLLYLAGAKIETQNQLHNWRLTQSHHTGGDVSTMAMSEGDGATADIPLSIWEMQMLEKKNAKWKDPPMRTALRQTI